MHPGHGATAATWSEKQIGRCLFGVVANPTASLVGHTARKLRSVAHPPHTLGCSTKNRFAAVRKQAMLAMRPRPLHPTDSILDEKTRISVMYRWPSCRAFRVTFSRDSMRITQSNADRRTPPRRPREPTQQPARCAPVPTQKRPAPTCELDRV